MTTETAMALTQADLENILVKGDLGALNAEQRTRYYEEICKALKLNPLTQPLQYLTLNGRLVLYAGKNATEQIAARENITIEIVAAGHLDEGTYRVHARAHMPSGRFADATGVLALVNRKTNQPLTGQDLANAYMAAETKASRRAVLRLAGLGMLDETEVDTIPDAVRVEIPPRRALPEEQRRALPEQRRPSSLERFKHWVAEQGMSDEDVLHVIGGERLDAVTLKEALKRMDISGLGELQDLLVSLWDDDGLVEDNDVEQGELVNAG